MSKFLTPPMWYDKNGNLNEMLTGVVSSDGVAVGSNAGAIMGGVAVGYNSGASNEGVAVGYKATADDYGIAIGSNVTSDGYGIAIGADATGNGIAIGGTAAANKVQLGSTNTTYDLTVGDGSGTLKIGSIAGIPKIGSIAFNKQRISNNRVGIGSPGVYLCCTTTGPELSATSDVAICFINDINKPASVLSSSAGSCSYANGTQFIMPGTNFTIQYCFKIVSL